MKLWTIAWITQKGKRLGNAADLVAAEYIEYVEAYVAKQIMADATYVSATIRRFDGTEKGYNVPVINAKGDVQ